MPSKPAGSSFPGPIHPVTPTQPDQYRVFWKKKVPPESAAGEQQGATPRKRIAVLGLADMTASSAACSVHSFPWSYSGETTIVADYDVAVVNLLDTAPQESFIPRGLPPEIDGKVVFGLLRAAGQLLIAGGEIVVVGHPEVHAKAQSYLGNNWSSLPHWTTMALQWDERAGDQIELLLREGQAEPSRFDGFYSPPRDAADRALRFLAYLEHLRRYEYSLTDAQLAPEDVVPRPLGAIAAGGPVEQRLRLDTRALARTRHGGAVASEHLIEVATRPVARRNEGWTVRRHGRVVLLPAVGLPPRQAVAFILRTAYGVHVPAPAPPWLTEIPAPGEVPVVAQLGAAQAELDAAASRLAALEAQRADVRDVLMVLAAADDELEDRVRDLLGRLGADVEPPIEKNKEDGWIHVTVAGKVLDGVLEIKSAQGETFAEKGPRQLMDWVKRTRQSRGRDYKGIFIGNAAYARPPGERGDPFSSSFRRTCETHGFVALTAATLLRELGRVVDEGADPATFWGELFQTRGVLD